MSQAHDDADKLGEIAHAKTKAAVSGKEVKPAIHHEAAKAHDAAAEAFSNAGNSTKANEHKKYADHHRSQLIAPKPEEKPKPGEKVKPKAKSFTEVMKFNRYHGKGGRFASAGGGTSPGSGARHAAARMAGEAAHAASRDASTPAAMRTASQAHANASQAYAASHGERSPQRLYHASQAAMHERNATTAEHAAREPARLKAAGDYKVAADRAEAATQATKVGQPTYDKHMAASDEHDGATLAAVLLSHKSAGSQFAEANKNADYHHKMYEHHYKQAQYYKPRESAPLNHRNLVARSQAFRRM